MIWATCVCLSLVMVASDVTRLLSAWAFVFDSSECAVFCNS